MQRALSFIPKLESTRRSWTWRPLSTSPRYRQKGRNDRLLLGGTLAWLASTRLKPDAAVGYYGGRIGNYAAEDPSAPVMLHFGKQDTHIPAEEVEKVQAAHPDVEVYWYDAGHAFNATPRTSYNPEAARVARERSLAFLKKHLA